MLDKYTHSSLVYYKHNGDDEPYKDVLHHNAHLQQQCHNSKSVIFFRRNVCKGCEVLLSAMSATTTKLLTSGEFCNLHYDTITVKRAPANVSFYTNNSKMPNFELLTQLSPMSDIVAHTETQFFF